MKNVSYDLIVVGDLVADIVVPIETLPLEAQMHQAAESIRVEVGGSGNTLIMGERLGLRTKLFGSIGNDLFGPLVLEMLAAEGTDVSDVMHIPNSTTTTSLVLVDKAAQHVFVGKFGTGDPVNFDPNWQSDLAQASAIFLSGYCLRENGSLSHNGLIRCLQIAQDAAVPIFFDLGPAYTLASRDHVENVLVYTTLFLATEEEIIHWTGMADSYQAGQAILARGPSTVIIKLGAAGCQIMTTGENIHCPGFAVQVRDSAGAGDAFAAGCIYAHLYNHSLEQMGRFANAVGAASVACLGTGTSLPDKSDVENVLNNKNYAATHH